MGTFLIGEQGKKAVLCEQLITTAGQTSLTDAMIGNSGADWLYIAVGQGTSTPGSAQTALDEELFRQAISARYLVNPGTVRLLAVFRPQYGVGQWKEIGIFDQDINDVHITDCEGTADFSSDGAITRETSIVAQGAASVETQMGTAGTVAFLYNPGSSTIGTYSFGSAHYFQFDYQTSHDVGTLTIRIGSSSSDYYEWQWHPGTVGDWDCFHDTFSNASVSGTPGSTEFNWFQITHDTLDVGTAPYTYNEYLDRVRIYQDTGTMFVRGTIDASKDWNTVKNVYYSLVHETQ